MNHYLLKLEGISVDELLEEIAWTMGIAIQSFGASPEDAREVIPCVKNSIKSVLKKHLHLFENCGKFSVCDSGITGKPVTVKGKLVFRPPKWRAKGEGPEKRYVIATKQTIDSVLDEILDGVVKVLNIDILEGKNSSTPFRRSIEMVMKSSLGRHIYTNDSCGREDCCKDQKELPVWGA